MNKKWLGVLLVVSVGFFCVGGTWISSKVIGRLEHVYKGVRIVLDAGHGGKDKGAQYGGVNESDLNLNIVQYIKEELTLYGIEVILTRDKDVDLASVDSTNRKREDMKKRIECINDEKTDFFISVHMNSYISDSVKGSHLFYKKGNEDALLFATFIQEELEHNKGIKEGDYYILNNSNKIGVLLECGFLSNEEERNYFKNEKNQKQFAKQVNKGVLRFLKETYE